jgi:hypothetical protein
MKPKCDHKPCFLADGDTALDENGTCLGCGRAKFTCLDTQRDLEARVLGEAIGELAGAVGRLGYPSTAEMMKNAAVVLKVSGPGKLWPITDFRTEIVRVIQLLNDLT